LEVHIEQGPVLLETDLPAGIVTAIAGNSRFSIAIEGAAGHAGTVPMAYRHDAAAAGAEIVLSVERRCKEEGLVGTVGRLAVPRGAINVIAGRCELSVDVRSADDKVRKRAGAQILADMEDIARRRGVNINTTKLSDIAAVPCSARLQDLFAKSVERAGFSSLRLPSGAGHDAVMFDGLCEIGMLFVRCGNGGVSHSPLETVSAVDAYFAAGILRDVLLNLRP
jgi:hydantoinase/carbamoylase family amidase